MIEAVDRSTQPDCSTQTPAYLTTMPPTTTEPPTFVIETIASGLYKIVACKGETKIINIPNNYIVFPHEIFYGVTTDGTCDTIG